MKTTLYQLAELIAKQTFLKNETYTNEKLSETIDEIVTYVYIIGEDNLQLGNPRNEEREVTNTGEEVVVGSYLLFDYIEHTEDMYIEQYQSLSALEKAITSSSGVINPFTTYQVAIVNGEVATYEIYFTNKKDGRDYKFNKHIHGTLPKSRDERKYEITNVRLAWKGV